MPGIRVNTKPIATRGANNYLLGLNSSNELVRFAGSGRRPVDADLTFYVRTDGDNSNNGEVDSAGGAFLTWQYAYDFVCANLDFNGHSITIEHGNEGAGVKNFAEAINFEQSWTGGGKLTLTGHSGDLTTPSNLVITDTVGSNGCFTNFCPLPGFLSIKGMKLVATNGYGAINQWGTGPMGWDRIDFGAVGVNATAHIWATPGDISSGNNGSYTISGGAPFHFFAGAKGSILHQSTTTTLTGTPAFGAFAAANSLGYIESVGRTFSGSATGPRYSAAVNGVIQTGGGGANYFPGNSAGSTATGGQYA